MSYPDFHANVSTFRFRQGEHWDVLSVAGHAETASDVATSLLSTKALFFVGGGYVYRQERDSQVPISGSFRFYIGRMESPHREMFPAQEDDYSQRVELAVEDGLLVLVRWMTPPPVSEEQLIAEARELNPDIVVEVAPHVRFLDTYVLVDEVAGTLDYNSLPYARQCQDDDFGLTEIGRLPNLETLNISGSSASDLNPLASLSRLSKLDISGCYYVSSVDALAQSVNIEHLNLRNTMVRDIEVVRSLPKLAHLDLRGTNIADLSPLESSRALRVLYLDEAQLASQQSLSHVASLVQKRAGLLRVHVDDVCKGSESVHKFLTVSGTRAGRPVIRIINNKKEWGNCDGFLPFSADAPEIVPIREAKNLLDILPPIQVGAIGNFVIFLPPPSIAAPICFSVDRYSKTLGGKAQDLPEMTAERLQAWATTLPSEVPLSFGLARGAADLPSEIELTRSLATLLQSDAAPGTGLWSFVPTPSRTAQYRAGDTILEIGVHQGMPAICCPELLGLPGWIASKTFESMLTPLPRPLPWEMIFEGVRLN